MEREARPLAETLNQMMDPPGTRFAALRRFTAERESRLKIR